MRNGSQGGVVIGLVAALAFATSGPVVKPLLDAGWTPGAAILARLGLGVLLLTVPTALALRGRWRLVLAEWRVVVGFGALGVAAAATLYYASLTRLPVAVALLVEYTGPLLLLGWTWLRFRRTPSRTTVLGAVVATVGLALVLDLAGDLRLDPIGLLLAFGAAIGNAAYFLFTARPSRLPAVALAGTGMALGLVIIAIVAAVGILPLRAPLVDVTLLGTAVSWVLPVLVVGVVPTALAYGLSAVSVRLLGDRTASFLALSEVLFAVALAWVLLGERPLPVQLVGAALVVAGVALVRRGEHGSTPVLAAT
ncbi:EamA family transporter [Nakamurella leprariae]|uniref:DMT family transporter n=1 Tax=Nakamurella leprariae TaxID=2803911 RepID=A0A938YI17_9ACTN|nr:DMT family transporter [Nakamurella leprariae]MBM9468712.1 DMT family transporter [Nakamurella leprariae]